MNFRSSPDVILDLDAAWLIEAADAYLHAVSQHFFTHADGAAADWAKAALCER